MTNINVRSPKQLPLAKLFVRIFYNYLFHGYCADKKTASTQILDFIHPILGAVAVEISIGVISSLVVEVAVTELPSC